MQSSLRKKTGRLGGMLAALVIAMTMTPLLGAAPPALAQDPNLATLVVNKGGDRDAPQTVAPLAGATFGFFAGTAGTRPAPGAIPTYTCTTGADGSCFVDATPRSGGGQGYWIIEQSAPAGWDIVGDLNVGGDDPTERDYNGVFTGGVLAGVSYQFPQLTTGNSNPTARGPVWADARDNPDLPESCGLNIALLIDVSGSIEPFLDTVKDAANTFVDALTGTPSQIALFSFSDTGSQILTSTPVSTPAGAAIVTDAVDALTADGTTNWDDGLWQVAAAVADFDAVVMLTDGNPTVSGPTGSGPGNFTRFTEIEQGIFSANAVKADGTKVVVVGVGEGLSGSTANLQAISGPVEGSDYVQTDFAELADVFRDIALATCAGTVNIVKQVIPAGGTVDDAVPTGGWTFSTTSADVTPASGQTANGTGAVSFSVDFGNDETREVTFAETLQPNFTLIQQDGFNAACTADGAPVAVTNNGALGFNVTATVNGIVSCTVINEAEEQIASVRVDKTWIINDVEYADPLQPAQFQADLELTGQTDPQWSTVYAGYLAGDDVTIGETIDEALLPTGCTVDTTGTGTETLAAGLNTFEVVNIVECVTELTLLKSVVNPFGEPEPATSWTLSAYLPDGPSPDPAFSGTTGVTSEVPPDVVIAMGESSVPGYTQDVVPGAVIVPPSTGSWFCSLNPNEPGSTIGGENGTVVLTIGQQASCTATNTAEPATLTLVKEVDNTSGGTATATDWLLEATPEQTETATPISGRSGEPSVTGVEAVPNVAYTLTEDDGPAGYDFTGVTCVLTGTTEPLPTPGNVLTPDVGQDITCTFANSDVAPLLTLVKDVVTGDADPAAWTLRAVPSEGAAIEGSSGSPEVTGVEARSNVAYALSETGGPEDYRLSSIDCVQGDGGQVPVVDDAVTLQPGQEVVCTFANRKGALPVTGSSMLPQAAQAGLGAVLAGLVLLVATLRRRRIFSAG
ncbi:prealbumin-like fold domain-containing protein [Melissospora conviva]|uniref:prealbumin-like fold domain-containing protein n=1 Tax=Melissospora conviva TaxID=3388432 RepID=UPI003B7C8F37